MRKFCGRRGTKRENVRGALFSQSDTLGPKTCKTYTRRSNRV